MGIFGFGNYSKPGRGVEKDEPEKRAVFKFFELYFRKFWKIMNASLLYFFASIPAFIIVLAAVFFAVSSFSELGGGALRTLFGDSYMSMVVIVSFSISLFYVSFIGAGPASAGFDFVMASFAGDYHTFVRQDFKEKIKENFKQAAAVFFIDLIAFVVMFYAFIIYYSFGGAIGYIRYIVAVVALIFAAMHIYIYPMMVGYELRLRDIYKNAFLLTMAKLPVNLILLVIIGGIHYFTAKFLPLPVFVLTEGFLLYGLTGFIGGFQAEIVFKKYFSVKGEEDGNFESD